MKLRRNEAYSKAVDVAARVYRGAAVPQADPRPARPLAALLMLLLVASFAGLRSHPPDPNDLTTSPTEFSAERAWAVLERVAGDGQPHAVGGSNATGVRDRIEAELTALGLVVQRQRAWSCRRMRCALVTNLIADVPGEQADGPVVLLTSHYDSVHAGPGIGDDLHGVAVSIEIARALLAGPARRHPVRVLIDEGEEEGLLGAAAFVEQHPAAAQTGVVVNVEARGTTGLSSMFETSDGNAALVDAYLRAAPRPVATSLAYEVYRRMPNDTDLTVFRAAGYPGINFAFVGEVGHYHTPRDDLDHLDPGSVQHQGDNALAAVRTLAMGPLPLPATEDSIYTDVLGLFVVSWPASWAVGVAVGLLGALLAMLALAVRWGRVRLPRVALGFVGLVGLTVLSLATGSLLAMLVTQIQGETMAAHAHPLPMRWVLWSTACAIAVVLAAALGRAARPIELAFGVWITLGLGGLALAWWIPGASVALCLPVGLAAPGLAWALWRPTDQAQALLAAAVMLVALWTALALALEQVFGFALTPAVAAPIGIAVGAVLPGLVADAGRWRKLAAAALTVVVASTVVACLVPVYDVDHPRRIALVHYEDRTAGTAIVAGYALDRPPAQLLQTAGWSTTERGVLPWSNRRMTQGPATPTTDPAPTLEVVDTRANGPGRVVQARLASARGATFATVVLPADVAVEVRVEGRPVTTGSRRRGPVQVFGLPAQGALMEFEFTAAAPVVVTVVDCLPGLPESAAAVQRVRDRDGVTVQWGDARCVGVPVSL